MSCSTLFSSHSGAMTISTMIPWILILDAECCYAECNIFGCCAECHYAGDVMLNVLRRDPILMSCCTLFSSLSGAMIISTMTLCKMTLDAECPIYGIALSVAMLSVTFFGVALIVIMLGDVMTSVVALLIRARECTKKR